MKARLIHAFKQAYGSGRIEGVIWNVPTPVPPGQHKFKYRLVYIEGKQRIVGYDNERGKGDHKHIRAVETSYAFVDVPTLLSDFMKDVEEAQRHE